MFIIDREIANVFEKINSFSNCEIQQQEYLSLKNILKKEIVLLEQNTENLKIYVKYAALVFNTYENIINTLENLDERLVKDKLFINEFIINKVKKMLNNALKAIPDEPLNEMMSEHYYEARRDLASFLQHNSKGFKKYSFPYLILM